MFLAPNFSVSVPAVFLDLNYYKEHPVSDHVAKFYNDRPRDLGERVATGERNKNIGSKT